MIYSFSGLMGKMNFISFLNFWIASTLTLILHWNALEKKQNFLDVTVELSNNQFVTDLYCYPTDSHQYLHYNFWHLEQMKKSSVYIQGLHIKQLCSDETFLSKYLKDLRSWFCKRGYPEIMVKEHLRRVENRIRDELSSYPNRCVGKMVGVSLIVTYHPHLNGLNKMMQKNLTYLQANQTIKLLFTLLPFVSFCKVHNLQSHLIFNILTFNLTF